MRILHRWFGRSDSIVASHQITRFVSNGDRNAPKISSNSVDPRFSTKASRQSLSGRWTGSIHFRDSVSPRNDAYFGETVLEWFTKGGFEKLYVVDGVISNDLGIKEDSDLWGVSSNPLGREALDSAGIQRIQNGIVSGITGYLIAEGERRGLEITALLAECNPMYPDARAALIAIDGLSDLMDMEIPVQELLEDAKEIEQKVREAFERAQSTALPAPGPDDEDDVPMMV